MIQKQTRYSRTIAAACIAVCLILVYVGLYLFAKSLNIGESEPDLYYQIAISKLSASEGLIRSLPQVEDLHWGERFVEKNLLFTLLSTTAYAIAGEPAVRLLVPLLCILWLAMLFCFIYRESGWPIAMAFAAILIFLTPTFAYRLLMLRPFLLALIFYTLLIASLLRSQTALTFLSCMGFSLSYHALYIPFFALIALLIVRKADRESRILCAVGSLGICAGLLCNPYYPNNLDWLITNTRIAFLGATLAGSPSELFRIPALAFILFYGGYLALLILCVHKVFRSQNTIQFTFLTLTSTALWGLTWISSRCIEYAVPSTLFLMALMIKKTGPRQSLIILLAVCALLLPNSILSYAIKFHYLHDAPQIREAIAHIPTETQKAKVFNCEWSTGPYLLYDRPDLRFVDLWGPYLLHFENPEKSTLKQALLGGKVGDPISVLTGEFKASLVLCKNPTLNRYLSMHPRVQTLYPKERSLNAYNVFKLRS